MKKICLLLSFVVIFINAHAQAPVNDEPCGAIDVPVVAGEPILVDCLPTIVYSYTNATLTPAIPNPTCVATGSAVKDIWYKFTVPASGSFVIKTANVNPSNVNDIVLSIFSATSCNGMFTQIDCNDDIPSNVYPRIQNSAIAGQVIYARIFMLDGSASAEFKMCVSDYSINNNPVVDNTNKVGIGTQNPLAKLDVAGSGLFRDQVTFVQAADFRSGLKIGFNASSNKVLTSDASGNASWGNLPIGASVWGVNGNNIYNTNINNVGIGTTLPFNKLTVTGNADFTGNVGIGTNSPSYPLNFANTAGDKISLAGSSTTSYGFGVQPNLMQLHTHANTANIAFGYGSSIDFTERARIINNGTDGMVLKGRLLLQNGSVPLDVNQQPGVWLYKADNSNILSFMGTQNNQNVGFYGGPVNNGWGFVYDAINSRVGIGTDNPTSPLEVKGQVTIDQKSVGGYGGLLLKGNTPGSNYPNIGFSVKNNSNVDVVGAMVQGELANSAVGSEAINLGFYTAQAGFGSLSQKMVIMGNGNVGIGEGNPGFPLNFPSTLGDKISLYGNAGNHYGFGVTGGTLQIHAGVATDDIAFGTGSSGAFTERFRFKGNGALAVGGAANTGATGQVLTSNGSASSPTWMYPLQKAWSTPFINGDFQTITQTTDELLTNLSTTILTSIPSTRLFISYNVDYEGTGCIGLGCSAFGQLYLYVDNVLVCSRGLDLSLGFRGSISLANFARDVAPGNHTVEVKCKKNSVQNNNFTVYKLSFSVIAMPQ
jgi:hypothetical protein